MPYENTFEESPSGHDVVEAILAEAAAWSVDATDQFGNDYPVCAQPIRQGTNVFTHDESLHVDGWSGPYRRFGISYAEIAPPVLPPVNEVAILRPMPHAGATQPVQASGYREVNPRLVPKLSSFVNKHPLGIEPAMLFGYQAGHVVFGENGLPYKPTPEDLRANPETDTRMVRVLGLMARSTAQKVFSTIVQNPRAARIIAERVFKSTFGTSDAVWEAIQPPWRKWDETGTHLWLSAAEAGSEETRRVSRIGAALPQMAAGWRDPWARTDLTGGNTNY